MRQRWNRLVLGTACVLAASTISVSSGAATDETSLTYGLASDINSLNIAEMPWRVDWWFFNSLYTFDESLSPVPDIAAELPEVSDDGLVWTVKLRDDVYFQPGDERLTAEDVIFTFGLGNSPHCDYTPAGCNSSTVVIPEGTDEPVKVLQGFEALDDFTVRFTLAAPYAPFLTDALPWTRIVSKDAVEASLARFGEQTEDVAAEDVDTIVAAGPEAATFRADAEALIAAAGLDLLDAAMHAADDGSLDEASYDAALESSLAELSTILNAEETDRIAAAYRFLDLSLSPVGTGPFYVTDFRPGQDITATRNERYHHGPAAFERLYIPVVQDDRAGAAALAAGDIDWYPGLTADAYQQVEDAPDVKFSLYPDFGYYALQFNLRSGRLFHERSVRQALAHCFDKEATVEAATDGWGVPIHSDIPPASWAYNPDVPRYEYDIEKGRAILEESGWVDADGDGVREKDGRPLHSHILLRARKPDRTRFMNLLADQARDCGFHLTLEEADFRGVLLPGLEWPLIMVGQDEQWDAYFGGWGLSYDPNPYFIWHSSQCVTEELPDAFNAVCFQDERVDELIMAGLRETDQAARAEIYREYATIMAEELPYLWAWSDEAHEGLRVDIHGAEPWTEEVMTSPNWFWQLEKINKGDPATAE